MSELRELEHRRTTWTSTLVPLALGAIIVIVRPSAGLATAALLVAGVVLGMMNPERPARQGVLVATPLALAAIAVGFEHSWQFGVLALVAAPFAAGVTSGAAIVGGMMQFSDREHRGRAAVLIAIVGAGVLLGLTLTNIGRSRIERDERHLRSASADALGRITSAELMLGASTDTWTQLGDQIGAEPLVSMGAIGIELRFDITPTIAPWLSRCLIATVHGVSDAPIERSAISFETTTETC